MKMARFFCALLLGAVSVSLVGSQAFSADDKTDEYTVIVKKVEVHKTKADGSSWDPMNGPPDLYVASATQPNRKSPTRHEGRRLRRRIQRADQSFKKCDQLMSSRIPIR